MASQFVGLNVQITIKDAQNTVLRGTIKEVIMNANDERELEIVNVYFPATHHVMEGTRVNGRNIASLEIIGPSTPAAQTPQPQIPQQQQPPAYQQPQQQSQQQYGQQQQLPMPVGPYGQTTASPVPPYYGNYPPPPHHQQQQQQQQHAPRHHFATQQFIPGQVPPGPVQPAQPAAPAAPQAPFQDPAIISVTRKPSIPSEPAAAPKPAASTHAHYPGLSRPVVSTVPTYETATPSPAKQQVQAPHELPAASSPIPTTPTRAPSQPSSAVMSRVGSAMGMNRNLSAQGQAPAAAVSRPTTSRTNTSLGSYAKKEQAHAAATLQQPFNELSLNQVEQAAADSSAVEETDDGGIDSVAPETPYNRQRYTAKRSRRGGRGQRRQQMLEQAAEEHARSQVIQPGMFAGAIAQAALAGTGMNASSQHVNNGVRNNGRRGQQRGNRNNRRGNGYYGNDEDGWATEDVDAYKEQEFDFQGNLDKFDKRTVFDQIKAEDTTADEARLVSFNRRPGKTVIKPAIRKNYLPTENVLGDYGNGPAADDSDFIAEESDDESSGDDLDRPGRSAHDSGRSSRHAISRQSMSNHRSRALRASSTRRESSENHLSSSTAGIKPTKPSFRIQSTNRPCPIISPLQMLDVERIAEVELGLTDDMMTENAGRGIAQVALQAFGKRITSYRPSTSAPKNPLPLVLVFAGNNKSGSRAIAAGRHMKNHHVRVMVCVLGLEREDELLENVRRQLNVFRNAGGRVARWEEMQASLKSLDSPPELIIDGLLGMHLSFEDLRTDDQQAAYELIQFANKSKANVLSVDIPSGIDGSTGKVANAGFEEDVLVSEGSAPVFVRANWVVCMGAPKSGLLNALANMQEGVGAENWKLFVADVGIPNTAWRKYGTRRRHGVEFATEWVVGLGYHAAGSGAC